LTLNQTLKLKLTNYKQKCGNEYLMPITNINSISIPEKLVKYQLPQ